MSPAHFSRCFRAAFGETPHRYLQRRRIERSMFLLRETDLCVTEVCGEVGFTSLGPPLHDEATAEQLRALVAKGALNGLVLTTADVRKLYETLKARGVTDFTQEPTDHFY